MQLYADRFLLKCVEVYKVLYTNQPAELFSNWQSHEMVIFLKGFKSLRFADIIGF